MGPVAVNEKSLCVVFNCVCSSNPHLSAYSASGWNARLEVDAIYRFDIAMVVGQGGLACVQASPLELAPSFFRRRECDHVRHRNRIVTSDD